MPRELAARHQNRGQRLPRLVLFLVVLLGSLLRFYDLGAESFTYDEGIMIDIASGSFAEMIETIKRGRPGVYVGAGFLWVHVFGDSEAGSRSLSALAGILSLPLLYLIGRQLYGVRVGLVAAFLMALSYSHILHSQRFRYYSLVVLVTLLSYWLFIHAVRSGRVVVFVLWVISGVLVFHAHYHGVFVLGSQFFWFFLFRKDYPTKVRRLWLASEGALVLLLIPHLLLIGSRVLAGTAGAMESAGGPLETPALWAPAHLYLVGFFFRSVENLSRVHLALSGAYLFGGLGVYLFWKGWKPWRRKLKETAQKLKASMGEGTTWLVVLWAVVPVMVPFLVSRWAVPIYMTRYTMSALPAVCLLLAFLVESFRRVVPAGVSLLAILVLFLPSLRSYYVVDVNDQWAHAAAYVEEGGKGGDVLVFASLNNEPASRIRSVFNRYYEGGLSQCGFDTFPVSPEHPVRKLEACGVGYQRIWFVTRVSEAQNRELVREHFFGPQGALWRVAEEREFRKVSVWVLTSNFE